MNIYALSSLKNKILALNLLKRRYGNGHMILDTFQAHKEDVDLQEEEPNLISFCYEVKKKK